MSETKLSFEIRNDLDDAIVELDKALALADVLHDYFGMSQEYHKENDGRELLLQYGQYQNIFMCLMDYIFNTAHILEEITKKDDEAEKRS